MRKKIIAGNWKMNNSPEDSKNLVRDTMRNISFGKEKNLNVIFCPPFTSLSLVSEIIGHHKENGVFTGGQNCHWEERGAFTGEISASMLKSSGADYVILGHSERRQYFNETDEIISKKIKVALKNHLIPVFCCGEKLLERKDHRHFEIVEKQISLGLFPNFSELPEGIFPVIAYEPVWAIGTGETATPNQAQEMHFFIRSLIAKKFGNGKAASVSILYGGSCNPKNSGELFIQPDIDGGLIGGASLKPEEFIGIINSI